MDIVESLRNRKKVVLTESGYTEISYRYSKECEDAADEIERLREALQKIEKLDCGFACECGATARSALQQKDSE